MPSIVAGLAYAISFSTLLYGNAHHSTLFVQFAGEMGLPFILWSLEYINNREGSYRYLLAFLLGLFALFSSNFPLSVPFVLLMIVAWFVLVRQNYSLRFLSIYCIFTAVLLIGNVPLILAMLTNAPMSHRAYWPVFSPLSGDFKMVLINSFLSGISFLNSI